MMQKAESDYWQTLEGLVSRAELVAQNFIWGLWNSITRMFSQGQEIAWVTAGDELVCDVCMDQEGVYDADDLACPRILLI